MSVFDQRLLLSFPFPLNPDLLIDKGIDPNLLSQIIDPSILSKFPHAQQSKGGGKINNSTSSFRISDLLESPNQESIADTSGSNAGSPSLSSCHERNSPYRCETPPHGGSPSEDGCSSLGKKARKARTIFTDKQLQELENTFDKQKYLSVQDRMELAQRMGLSDTQVKTWYQNRRTKWKRQAAVGLDLLNEAGNMAAVQSLLRTSPYWSQYLQQQALIGPIGQSTTRPPSYLMGAGLPTSMHPGMNPSLTNFPLHMLSFPQNVSKPEQRDTSTPESAKDVEV